MKNQKTINGAFPMICFCDIPLSKAKEHLSAYGCYGLGLSKSWAKSKGLNPVLYIDKHSDIGDILHRHTFRAVHIVNGQNNSTLDDFAKICSYLKNYEGILKRNEHSIDDYRFYDEREWRYVPEANLLEGSNAINMELYLSDKPRFNDKASKITLQFTHADISYIIVHEEKEIPELTKHLRNCYADKCTSLELEVLLTRIITTNQIIRDF